MRLSAALPDVALLAHFRFRRTGLRHSRSALDNESLKAPIGETETRIRGTVNQPSVFPPQFSEGRWM
jgi:hypothetical protein